MFARLKIKSIRVQFGLAFLFVLILAALLTVVIDSRISDNNQVRIKETKDRIYVSKLQSDLRKHVEFSIQDFNLFIINPADRFRDDYYFHIFKAIEFGSNIAESRSQDLNVEQFNIAELNKLLEDNKQDVTDLFSIRTDPLKLYPSMSLANDVMFEFNIAIISVLESAIIETQMADEIDYELLSLLTKTKDNWRRTINLYRLYLINRIGSLYESDLPLQVTGIIDSYNSYLVFVDKIANHSSDIDIGIETSEVNPTLSTKSKEWYEKFIAVSKMNLKNNWRGDISILTERIYPNILKIFLILNKLDSYLVESSVSDLNEQELVFSKNSQALWSLVTLLLIIFAISYFVLNRTILNPLLELSKYFRDEKQNDFGSHKIHASNMEMNNFVQAVEYMQKQVNTQQTELKQMAMHDPLTSLPNRFYLSRIITDHMVNCKITSTNFAVFLLDLNNFKKINDSLGHNIGDEALCDVANRLASSIRSSDFLARLGGDEFAMIVSDATEQKLKIIAEQIHRSLKPDYSIGNQKFNIGVSIGIAIFPDHADTEKELLKCADIAMYRAKKSKVEYNLYRGFDVGKVPKFDAQVELET